MSLIFCLLMPNSTMLHADSSPLAEGEHCVAYETFKRVAFISDKKLIGKNCKIESSLIAVSDEKFVLQIHVPIKHFKSGNSNRDLNVAKILNVTAKPVLRFTSSAFSRDELSKLISQKNGTLAGNIELATGIFKVSAIFNISNGRASGKIITSFANLKMEPHSVGPGGIISRGQDKLTLHFQLQLSRIKELDTVVTKYFLPAELTMVQGR